MCAPHPAPPAGVSSTTIRLAAKNQYVMPYLPRDFKAVNDSLGAQCDRNGATNANYKERCHTYCAKSTGGCWVIRYTTAGVAEQVFEDRGAGFYERWLQADPA